MPPYASLLGKRNCVLYSGKPGSLLGNMWNCWDQYRIYCKIRMLLMEMGKWKMFFLVTFLKKISIFLPKSLFGCIWEQRIPGYPQTMMISTGRWWSTIGFLGYPIFRETNLLYWTRLDGEKLEHENASVFVKISIWARFLCQVSCHPPNLPTRPW
jgi:hypothetical protein